MQHLISMIKNSQEKPKEKVKAKKFTQEEDELIKEIHKTHTLSQAAKLMGRNQSTISQRAVRIGYPFKP